MKNLLTRFKNNTYWNQLNKVTFLKYFLFYKLKDLLKIDGKVYFSQTGEDQIIEYYLKTYIKKEHGFYLDIGCNHPTNISNTFFFYLQGWKGICIDLNERYNKEWRKIRPKDIFINAVISDEDRDVNVYKFFPDAVSTIDENIKDEWMKYFQYVSTEIHRSKKLTSILDQYISKESEIDFLTIDIEGAELQALKSLDFKKYRPKMIIAESHYQLENKENELRVFLETNNYNFLGHIVVNGYWIDNKLL
jgi:hypothetical protein